MNDNLHTQMVFEENRKSVGIAYLLWLFLGLFGVHRFYTGRTKSAIAMLILTLTGAGVIVSLPWWVIDVFRVPGHVNRHNLKTIEMLNSSTRMPAAPEIPRQEHVPERDPIPLTSADKKRQAMLDDLRQTGYKKERRERNLFR